MRRVTFGGELLPAEAVEVEVTLKLTVEEMALIQRAREVQAAAGHVPTTKDVVVKALKDHLERRDPMKKAERALARDEKKAGEGSAARQTMVDSATAVARQVAPQTPAGPGARQERSRYIPAAVRHAVFRRDKGQCTYMYADGSRCGERAMVELDHYRRLFCRGGEHSVEDLTLRCRHHNQAVAAQVLGHAFMAMRRGS